jgi:putative spermidine/putrescine transport system substrate-binding protein
MKSMLKACVSTLTAAAVTTALSGAAMAQLKEVGKGEGAVDIVAWPGYIERGETDKNFDWVTGFEKKTGCKVNVKTAATSDEMVALMNEGGFDLVTASGDASLRLIAGKKVQPVNIWRSDPELEDVDERLQNAPWHTVDGALRRALPVGRQRAHAYNTKVFREAPEELERGVRGAEPAGRQVQQGPRPGLRRPDLHRRRRALPDEEEAGARHQGPLRAERRPSTRRRSTCCAAQRQLVGRYWHDAFVQIDDFKNEGVVASGSWPFQVNLLQADKRDGEADRLHGAGGRRHRLGRHHHDARRSAAPQLRLHVAGALAQPKVQGDLAAWFGSVPAVPAACKGNALLGQRVATPTASTTSRRSTSGARRWPVQAREALRALLSLGHRHDRGSRRPLSPRKPDPSGSLREGISRSDRTFMSMTNSRCGAL